MISVSQPLKWDIFNGQGKLLLHKGYVLQNESQLESLLERGMFADASEVEKEKSRTDVKKIAVYDPFAQWESVAKNCSRLSLAYLNVPAEQWLGVLDNVLGTMSSLVEKAPDAAIFELMQMNLSNYVVAHNQQTAFMATLIATNMGWSPTDVCNVGRAAATMNIAALQLHATLSQQKEPITEAQREEMRSHGARGRIALEEMGVTNQDWLRAVEDHHPEAIPGGRKPSEMADLIHHADVYLAKISPRAYRAAKAPNVAAKELVQTKNANPRYVSTIIKEIGVYPPGSYVKLANGETAIVTRRGKQAHTPIVYSLSNGAGMPLGEPIMRDTSAPQFAVASIVPKNKVLVTVNRAKLFGTESRSFRAFG